MNKTDELIKEYFPEVGDIYQSEPLEILPLTLSNIIEEVVTSFQVLLDLNEDDFDRGKGKYILQNFINKYR